MAFENSFNSLKTYKWDFTDYKKLDEYFNFIKSVKPRKRNDAYTHAHHVLPRCMGGKDEDNLIILSLAEHWYAHILLAEAFKHHNVTCALGLLAIGLDFNKNLLDITPDEFEHAKLRQLELSNEYNKTKRSEDAYKRWSTQEYRNKQLNIMHSEEYIENMRTKSKNNWKNEEYRNKVITSCAKYRATEKYANYKKELSEKNKGENNPFYGKKHSKESLKRMSESHKGFKHSEESKKKLSEYFKGRIFSEETLQKMRESAKIAHNTPEAKENHSRAGKLRMSDPKAREHMSLINRGKNSELTTEMVIKILKLHFIDGLKYKQIQEIMQLKKPSSIYNLCKGLTFTYITHFVKKMSFETRKELALEAINNYNSTL